MSDAGERAAGGGCRAAPRARCSSPAGASRRGDAGCCCIPRLRPGDWFGQRVGDRAIPDHAGDAARRRAVGDAGGPTGGLSSAGSYGVRVPMSGLSPAGLSIIGLLTALLGAWAGLSCSWGPRSDGAPTARRHGTGA